MTIHCIHGDEQFLINQCKSNIIKTLQCPSIVFQADNDIESLYFSSSLLDPSRIIHINLDNTENFKAFEYFIINTLETYDTSSIQNYIVAYQYSKLNKKQKLYKSLSKLNNSTLYEFASFKPWETDKVVNCLQQYAIDNEIIIDNNALHSLIQLLGANLNILTMELNKIFIYNSKKKITNKLIKEIVSNEYKTVFNLADDILENNANKIIENINILTKIQPLLVIINILQTVFYNYLTIYDLHQQKYKPQGIADILKIHSFRIQQDIKKLTSHSHINFEYLHSTFTKLNQLEYSLKTGKVFDPIIYMKLLFVG